MEEFTEFTSEVVEFSSTWKKENFKKLVSTSCNTDPLPSLKNQISQTNIKQDAGVQTENELQKFQKSSVDEKKLLSFIKKVYPLIESELIEGITPIFGHSYNDDDNDYLSIKPYQKITIENLEQYNQGTATWLSVRTNNAPILVVSGLLSHNDWCEHVNQEIKIYVPKRLFSHNFVEYIELKSIPVKSCVKSLVTNSFNKDIFASGTVSGDLCVYKYIFDNHLGDVQMLFSETTQHGPIISMDWLSEYDLLICQSDGIASLWKVHKEIILYQSYKLKCPSNITSDINLSIVRAISTSNFVIGTNEGALLMCNVSNSMKQNKNFINPVIHELENHKFQVTSLLKVKINENDVLISCDLSGEIYFHDIQSPEDGPTLIVKMPLPFKNCITCLSEANYILCPGFDGSLEIFKVSNGNHYVIDGSLKGKGNMIKVSENGSWLVSGVYEGAFQIFEIKY